jgi:hypothetical protein
LDAHDIDLSLEFVAVYAIAVSQEVFRSGVERKGFSHLLRGPFGCGMSGDVEVDDASAIMCEHNEDEQNLKPDRVHREEVDRHELRCVIGKESSPGFGMAVSDDGPCIWQQKPERSQCQASTVRCEFEALPRVGSLDSWFESDREFPLKQADVLFAHDESPKSSTNEILDGANRQQFRV